MMTTILTDSMAREHAESLQATAASVRRAREARRALRTVRRAERQQRRGRAASRAAGVGHAAARPFAAMRHWLVAGQL